MSLEDIFLQLTTSDTAAEAAAAPAPPPAPEAASTEVSA
jgi:hypothetical protein